jgi:hypothetical protein
VRSANASASGSARIFSRRRRRPASCETAVARSSRRAGRCGRVDAGSLNAAVPLLSLALALSRARALSRLPRLTSAFVQVAFRQRPMDLSRPIPIVQPFSAAAIADAAKAAEGAPRDSGDDSDESAGEAAGVRTREKQIRGPGGSLDPPEPLPTHPHTVYMEHSERLPNPLNPWLRGPVSSWCARRRLRSADGHGRTVAPARRRGTRAVRKRRRVTHWRSWTVGLI